MTKNQDSMTDIDDKMVDIDETKDAKKAPGSEIDFLRVEDFTQSLKFIATGVQQKNDRVLGRAWRLAYQLRPSLNPAIILKAARAVLPEKETERIVSILGASGDEAADESMTDVSDANHLKEEKVPLPEVVLFIKTFVVIYLIDKKMIDQARELSSQLVEYIDKNLSHIVTANIFASKAYFYYSYAYELSNRLPEIRPVLLTAFRKATLRHNHNGQAMLMNLLLRNYLSEGLYEEARKLIEKTPEIEFRSTAQLARFHYYEGRIAAIQLDYAKAFNNLETASRKAPVSARGFRLGVYKLMIVVQLLLGEIPDRTLFEQPEFKYPLRPYFELTKQVRIGDLATFKEIVGKYCDLFIKDHTLTLIHRIRQNVIRTGLHKISLSYSKISFQDICEKLNLDNPDDVECIVAKAIRDRIIDAVIDHENGFISSKQRDNIYSTLEPADSFHSRIKACMDIQLQAVKALRFPPRGFLDAEQRESREERKKQIHNYIEHHTQKEEPSEEKKE